MQQLACGHEVFFSGYLMPSVAAAAMLSDNKFACAAAKRRKRSDPGASGGEGGERVTAVVGGNEFAEVGEQRAAL
jgi:hypothetical protein